ncbi:MAG: hypothetical protein C4326_15090 [Ignavibacteria bacterium]
MYLLTGCLKEIFVEGGVTKGKVQVGGAFTTVILRLLLDARVGDTIVVDSGVAIGVNAETSHQEALEETYVPRDSR